MVENEEGIEDVLPRFLEFIGDSVVVAHNANSLKLSIITPFWILIAPISIILSFLDENPVVSKSNTT